MKSEIYYTLETDDGHFAKRLGECLNMISFVFTHHPELRIVKRVLNSNMKGKKPKDYFNPHGRVFNGGPFTAQHVQDWSEWVDNVMEKGAESVALQHPAYRTGHEMALRRFRETADDFLELFEKERVAA